MYWGKINEDTEKFSLCTKREMRWALLFIFSLDAECLLSNMAS
jgi:hypothetical protein